MKSRREVPFYRPPIGAGEIRDVTETLKSGWITTGPKAKEFETKFAVYVGAKNAVALNSCTAALHLALVAFNLQATDEVIIPTYTFAATGETVIHAGGIPILVDSEPETLTIDPQQVRMHITPRTRGIVAVDLFGLPCDYRQLKKIARDHRLFLIADAAHSLGAVYYGKSVGTLADATAFSFYATKNLTTGEGGMLTTDDRVLTEKVARLSLHGMSRDAWKRYAIGGTWYYELLEAGFKYNFTDLQAALGLRQLARFSDLQKKRAQIAQWYDSAFCKIPEIILPPQKQGLKHAWHLYVIRLHLKSVKIDRNRFMEELAARGVGTSVHFIPLHLHPYYHNRFGYHPQDFPVAFATYQQVISLPLYPALSKADVKYVIKVVQEVIAKFRQ